MKKKSSFLLVLALCMALVPLLAFNAQPAVAQEVPEQQPLWSYTIGSPVGSVAISGRELHSRRELGPQCLPLLPRLKHPAVELPN
jgi:hypothetical protein